MVLSRFWICPFSRPSPCDLRPIAGLVPIPAVVPGRAGMSAPAAVIRAFVRRAVSIQRRRDSDPPLQLFVFFVSVSVVSPLGLLHRVVSSSIVASLMTLLLFSVSLRCSAGRVNLL